MELFLMDNDLTYKEFYNKTLKHSCYFSFVVFLGLFFLGNKSTGLSFMAGIISGQINFFLMSKHIEKFASKQKTAFYLFKTTGVRFLLLGILIAIFMSKSWFLLFPFIAGLFSIQMIIFLENVYYKK